MTRRPSLLLILILSFVVAAGAVLVIGSLPSVARQERGREFQKLVGGLGFGMARDLRRCAFVYDPRLSSACSEDWGPIPGGAIFCPYDASSVRVFPPRSTNSEPPADAQVP